MSYATYLGWNIIPMPTAPAVPRTMEADAIDIVATVENPFTGQMQTQDWGAAWMEWSVSYQAMTNAQAQAWIAWLMALHGQQNIFVLGDPLNTAPQLPTAVAPIVDGADQIGTTLVTTGVTDLSIGDWINLPTGLPGAASAHLHKITDIASPFLSIWPPIRQSPGDGDHLVITNTKGMWRLKANSRRWSVAKDKTYTLTFECREVI